MTSFVAKSLSEPGCEAYEIIVRPEEPGIFYLKEVWTTQAMLDRHIQQDYIQYFLNQQVPLLLAKPFERLGLDTFAAS